MMNKLSGKKLVIEVNKDFVVSPYCPFYDRMKDLYIGFLEEFNLSVDKISFEEYVSQHLIMLLEMFLNDCE